MKKTALVTGACKRLGKEIALNLAQNGYDVIMHCFSSIDESREIQEVISSFGVKSYVYQADFTKTEAILNFIGSIKTKFKKIDLLINNAAIFERKNIIDTTPELFDAIYGVNIKAPYALVKYLSPLLENGNIINILDSKILSIDTNYFAYSLAKKSLADLTMFSAKEFAPKIRTNGIALGLMLKTDNPDKIRYETLKDKIPLKNKIELKYLFDTIHFIAANEALTGQIIYLDGGLHLNGGESVNRY